MIYLLLSEIDECKTTYPCSHFCHNTVGSFYCECAEHYKLKGDKRHCSLTNEGKNNILTCLTLILLEPSRNINLTLILPEPKEISLCHQ